jgi:hypothetical protein
MNGHTLWGIDAESNGFARYAHYGDFDFVPDVDRFADSACKYKHGEAP